MRSDASDHRHNSGDPVPFYANKVDPFHNPRYLCSFRDHICSLFPPDMSTTPYGNTSSALSTSQLDDDVDFYQTASSDVAGIFQLDPKAKRPTLVLLKKEVVLP